MSRPWGHPQPSTKHRTGSSGPWQPLPGGVEGTGLTVPGATWPEASGGLGSTALSCNRMGEQLRDQGGEGAACAGGRHLHQPAQCPASPAVRSPIGSLSLGGLGTKAGPPADPMQHCLGTRLRGGIAQACVTPQRKWVQGHCAPGPFPRPLPLSVFSHDKSLGPQAHPHSHGTSHCSAHLG